jgi:hypothetical protein
MYRLARGVLVANFTLLFVWNLQLRIYPPVAAYGTYAACACYGVWVAILG